MSDTETTDPPELELELEETTDLNALEGSNAEPDSPKDGTVDDAEPEGEDEDAEARGMPPRLSQRGAGFIALFEGCVLHMYNDPTRNATIGVGHLIHLGPINGREPQEFRRGITRKRALALLMNDADKAARSVRRLIRVPLTQHQLDALISFTFNCGEGALAASTLRKRLNRREYAAVPQELNKWVLSGGKRLPGLVRRRKGEGALFTHGRYN
jgi:GH24 family phage-related lysozyme (muramidase)